MVRRRARIHDVLKVKVKVKGHVIRALLWCHEMFDIQYGLTFCLYIRSLYETPLYSPSKSNISISQLSTYWNELLRHWRSGLSVGLTLLVWWQDGIRPEKVLLWQAVFFVNPVQCAAKKYPLKFFDSFLATARNFLHEISHIYCPFINHVKLLSSIVLFLIVTKLLNFLGDRT